MYGAIPPTLLLSIPLLAWFGIPFGEFWDVAVVAILAGMIPTRFGCLGAGCCAGRPTAGRFGMRLRNARGVVERRFPSPLLEAALGGLLLGASLLLFDRLPSPGAVALFAIAGYGAGRLFLEALREEHAPRFMGLGEFQWMSAALMIVGTLGLVGLGTGWISASGPLSTELWDRSTAHIFAAGLLLFPVVHLFRFLGCTLLFKPDDPEIPEHILQMIAVVPDIGSGEAAVSIRFEKEPEIDEIDQSPVDLAPNGVGLDGRLRFETLTEIPEGAYRATCTVTRPGEFTRTAFCSGELTGPGLTLAFNAEIGDAPNALSPRLCFEPAPSP